jgi:hypothetical protein
MVYAKVRSSMEGEVINGKSNSGLFRSIRNVNEIGRVSLAVANPDLDIHFRLERQIFVINCCVFLALVLYFLGTFTH